MRKCKGHNATDVRPEGYGRARCLPHGQIRRAGPGPVRDQSIGDHVYSIARPRIDKQDRLPGALHRAGNGLPNLPPQTRALKPAALTSHRLNGIRHPTPKFCARRPARVAKVHVPRNQSFRQGPIATRENQRGHKLLGAVPTKSLVTEKLKLEFVAENWLKNDELSECCRSHHCQKVQSLSCK